MKFGEGELIYEKYDVRLIKVGCRLSLVDNYVYAFCNCHATCLDDKIKVFNNLIF